MEDNFKTVQYGACSNKRGIGEFEKTHFAKGSVRYAFLGSAKQDDKKSEEMCVLKMFKRIETNTFKNWTCDIDACLCALRLAEAFCKKKIYNENNEQMNLKNLTFVLPKVLKLEGHHHHIPCCMQYFRNESYSFVVIVEPYLSGSYIKFSDNYGYENNGIYNADLLFAFSHWTYEFTNKEYMVSDLQGIIMEDKYVLTDPAVHSIKQVYGLTDLGYIGMQKVLNGHTCNHICKSLGLDPIKKNIPTKHEKQGTRHKKQRNRYEEQGTQHENQGTQHEKQGTRLSKELTKDEKKTNAKHKKSLKKRRTSYGQSTCLRFFKGSSAVYPTVPNSKISQLSFTSKSSNNLISKMKIKNPKSVSNLTVIQENDDEEQEKSDEREQ